MNGFSANLRIPTRAADPGRQLGGGGKGGGTGLLEKTGLNLSQSSQEFSAKTDDTGGGGSNGGKVNNGGSGGDGDEGDDDDYFDNNDDEVREDRLPCLALGLWITFLGRSLSILQKLKLVCRTGRAAALHYLKHPMLSVNAGR